MGKLSGVNVPGQTTFQTVLVANRGEIACRVIRTLRRLGITSVAVFSDADAGARHVAEADLSVRLGPASALESYLAIEKVVAAASRTGAEAIHPGYGFLAENARFAEACTAAGIVFIGPPPAAIRTMGDKIAARAAVTARGVPVVPGIARPGLFDDDLIGAAHEIGYPVLIKPSAGGGGKGMRRVDTPAELPAALHSARREARGAFGDDALFLERFVDTPRHIEIQMLADRHGRVIHLGERECSLQRRHQKVIEECPSPLLDEVTRTAMGASAVEAARSVGYVGAGTVEFIVPAGEPEQFSFMEMNTRIQVEHPVTERVTGVDLVEWQIRIAAGEPLSLNQEDITFTGHAIEARIYAEDPIRGFLPSAGTILGLQEPAGSSGAQIRIDSGIQTGSVVGTDYDPMLAKIIAHGSDRGQALHHLGRALARTAILGVHTNIDFCRFLLNLPDVVAGSLDTGLLERSLPAYEASTPPPQVLIAAAYSLVSPAPGNLWDDTSAWRLGEPGTIWTRFGTAQGVILVGRTPGRGLAFVHRGEYATADPRFHPDHPGRSVHSVEVVGPELCIDEVRERWLTARGPDGSVWVSGEAGTFHLQILPLIDPPQRVAQTSLEIRSPMPGLIRNIHVSDRATVEEGAPLITLEAMKMEQTLMAPVGGVVSLAVTPGVQVSGDQLLAALEPAEELDANINEGTA